MLVMPNQVRHDGASVGATIRAYNVILFRCNRDQDIIKQGGTTPDQHGGEFRTRNAEDKTTCILSSLFLNQRSPEISGQACSIFIFPSLFSSYRITSSDFTDTWLPATILQMYIPAGTLAPPWSAASHRIAWAPLSSVRCSSVLTFSPSML